MFLDILTNTITINKKLAQLLGLKTAVYLAELVDLYNAAYKTKALNEECYMVRPAADLVTADTTLVADDQATALANLVAAGLVEADDEALRIRSDRIVAMITATDTEALSQILADTKADKEAQKKSKEDFIKEAVKKNIKTDSDQVREALCGWIDTMYSVKHPVSKNALAVFQKQINDFTKDTETQLRIIEIAVMKSYVDSKWAIESYKREQVKNINSRLPSRPAAVLGTPQKIATSVDQVGKGF